jgi:hypothetical protein
MLSSVLDSERAIQVNIAIMRAFVRMRHALVQNRDLIRRVEKVEGKIGLIETDIRFILQDIRDIKKPLEIPPKPHPTSKDLRPNEEPLQSYGLSHFPGGDGAPPLRFQ